MGAGLYIHIPFCEIKCGYCDFYVVANKPAEIPAYLKALKRELALYAGEPESKRLTFDTLYFGGGTPSLLTARQINALIDDVFSAFSFLPNAEITVEVNPGTVDRAKLQELRLGGVNRLSVGAQSFDKQELGFLDRNHSVADIHTCCDDARKAGFANLSLDLIFGLPSQALETWQSNLSRAAELQPDHISVYNLTYEPKTPLAHRLRSGEIHPLRESLQKRMYFYCIEFLARHGYEHYEISNFARPDRRSRHNQKYWDGDDYLGIGVSSHSFINGTRFWNVRSLRNYLKMLQDGIKPIEEQEELSPSQKSLERVFLGLRQTKGMNLSGFEVELGTSFFQNYGRVLSKFFPTDFSDERLRDELLAGRRSLRSGLLEIDNGFLRLTRNGLFLSDAICGEFT